MPVRRRTRIEVRHNRDYEIKISNPKLGQLGEILEVNFYPASDQGDALPGYETLGISFRIKEVSPTTKLKPSDKLNILIRQRPNGTNTIHMPEVIQEVMYKKLTDDAEIPTEFENGIIYTYTGQMALPEEEEKPETVGKTIKSTRKR